jgi:hypothetical protein
MNSTALYVKLSMKLVIDGYHYRITQCFSCPEVMKDYIKNIL